MPLLISGPRSCCDQPDDTQPVYRIVPLQDRAYLFIDGKLATERVGRGAVASLISLCSAIGIDVVGEGIDRSNCPTRVDNPAATSPLCLVG